MERYQLDNQKILINFLENFYLKNLLNEKLKWYKSKPIEFFYKSDYSNTQEIYTNLSLILQWFLNNKIFIPIFYINYDIFDSKILDIFIENIRMIPVNIQNQFGPIYLNYDILNYDINLQNKIQYYQEICKKNNILLVTSITVKDLSILNNQEYLLFFNNNSNIKLQPILTIENINNINKIIDQLQYIINNYSNISIKPLKIFKNNQWTEKYIQKYQDLIIYIWQYYLLTNESNDINNLFNLRNSIFDICKINWNKESICECKLKDKLYINLFDLSLPLCYALNTIQFQAGYFEKDNNSIVNIIPYDNLSNYLQIKTLSSCFYPGCVKCIYKNVCNKGCLNEQFNTSGELLLPIINICKLEQTRINTLLKLYLKKYHNFNNVNINDFFKEWLIIIQKNLDS